MAINLDTYQKGTVLRNANQTEPASATFTLFLPSGTPVVGGGNVVKVVRLGEDHTVLSVALEVTSSLAASGLTFDVGTDLVPDCFIDGGAIGNGSGGMIQLIGGNPATNAGFADGYVAPSTAVRDLQFTIIGTATTPVTVGDRYINLTVSYIRNLPNAIITGVTNPLYPFSGSLIRSAATEFDYNGLAP